MGYLKVCTECPMFGKSDHGCLRGPLKRTDVMIVLDSPSFLEDSTGEFGEGVATRYLRTELDMLGLDIESTYWTYAIKCYSGSAYPKEAAKICKDILWAEIRKIRPRFILALGANALYALTGKKTIHKHRGELIELDEIKLIATLHPGVVIRQPSHLWEWRADLAYFVRMTKEEWRPPSDFKWMLVDSMDKALELIESVKRSDEIAYDIETTTLKDHRSGKILMVGVATPEKCYVIPWEVPFTSMTLAEVKLTVEQIVGSAAKKVAHNAKFDNRWLRSRGIRPWVDTDTYLAAYVLNNILPHGLKWLSKAYFGAADYGKGIEFKEDLTYEEFIRMAEYCALDVYYTLRLAKRLREELQKDGRLYNIFRRIIMPGERVLQKIEERGVYVDLDRLRAVKSEYHDKLREAEEALKKVLPSTVDWDVNWNSSDQVAKVLFEHCGLKPIEYTEAGKPSTRHAVLVRLTDKHEIPRLLLEMRKYSKAISGFLEPWERLLVREIEEGRPSRLYTTYNIAKTATGRLSAEEPNLQQVPRDTTVRSLISAPKGRVLIQADYSQIELRVAAFIAGENTMKQIYREGGDIHTKTACDITKKSPDEIVKTERTQAKAVNFGYLYGMGHRKFKDYAFESYGVVLTEEQAKRFRDTYFESYSDLLAWHERQREEVRKFKGVRSPLGRFRHLPDIDSFDKELSHGAERQAINTPVQSMASDMTLIAMILIDKELEKRFGDAAFLVGQVHDAILAECDEKDAAEVGKIIKTCMESVPKVLWKYFGINFDVPVVAEVEVGSWGAGKPLEKFLREGLDKPVKAVV